MCVEIEVPKYNEIFGQDDHYPGKDFHHCDDYEPPEEKRVVICQYCGEEARLITGDLLYFNRSDLSHKYFWRCDPCDAHVGCKQQSENEMMSGENEHQPMGPLADKDLRKFRMLAHNEFDKIWKARKGPTRSQAYDWLSKQMNLSKDECHIGQFDTERCQKAIFICITYPTHPILR